MKKIRSKLVLKLAQVVPWSNTYRFQKLAEDVYSRSDASQVNWIKKILDDLAEVGGNTFDLQIYKLLELIQLCNEHKQSSLLEIGSGSSTPILASYAEQNSAKLVTIEEHESWQRITKDLVKEHASAGFVSFPRR